MGSIISVALAVGPISRLFTWRMYLAIEYRSAWDSNLHFSATLLEELRFWHCNIGLFNGCSLRPPPDSSTVIFSDANDVGLQPITTLGSYGLTQVCLPRMQWRGCPGSRLEHRKQLDVSPSSTYCRLGPSSQVFFWTRDPDCPGVAVGVFLAFLTRRVFSV